MPRDQLTVRHGAAAPVAPAATDLRGRITALEHMNIAALRDAWKKAWRSPAPKSARKRFLMLGIAWKWQAELSGGYGPELARRLSALETRGPIGTAETAFMPRDVKRGARPMPGTRLIRDWKGERYEVHVTERGYLWRGQTYGSLSSVAKAITGVSRNGPKFFGLRDRQKSV